MTTSPPISYDGSPDAADQSVVVEAVYSDGDRRTVVVYHHDPESLVVAATSLLEHAGLCASDQSARTFAQDVLLPLPIDQCWTLTRDMGERAVDRITVAQPW